MPQATLTNTVHWILFPQESTTLMDLTTEQIKATLIHKYKCSEFSTDAMNKIQQIKLIVYSLSPCLFIALD